MNEKIYEVGEINNLIKRMMDRDPVLSRIYIRGEISNYKVYPSGVLHPEVSPGKWDEGHCIGKNFRLSPGWTISAVLFQYDS